MQHNHLGSYGNSLRVFVTDAGADQILTLDAPAGTDDYRFVRAGAVVSGNKGGKVFRYSVKLTLESTVNGEFIPDEPAWSTAAYYSKFDRVTNGGNIYQAQGAGTSGASAPTHTSGLDDGGVSQVFIGADAGTTIEIGGADQTVTVLSWNPTDRVLERLISLLVVLLVKLTTL